VWATDRVLGLVKYAATWYSWKASFLHEVMTKFDVDGIQLTVSMNLKWRSRLGSEFFRDLSLANERPTYKWNLLNLLSQFRPRLASDPRDKLYALLGVSLGDDDPLVKPDYSKGTMKVFWDATRSIIKDHESFSGKLQVLQWAVPHSKELGWPSWVPDWRITDISDVGIGLAELNASFPAKYRPIESLNPNTLKVEGRFIGRATYVSRHHHAGDMTDNMEAEYEKCTDLLSSYPTGEDLQTVFGLTLFAN
jgi:hypothetical protein